MNGQKIFVGVLLLIGVLFVVSLYLGAIHPDNRSFKKVPDWVSSLGTASGSPQSLKIADLSPTPTSMGCLQGENIVVRVESPCTFAIRQSFFSVRVVKLQLAQGTSAVVMLTQEETMKAEQPLSSADITKDDMKVYPGKVHGELTITCLDTSRMSSCTLILE